MGNLHAVAQSKYPAMVSMYVDGKTLSQVGQAFGVSKARAHQVIVAAGARRAAQPVGVEDLVAGAQSKRDRKESACRARWGMSVDEYRAVVAAYGNSKCPTSPIHKYKKHQANAAQRGISWEFTFAEWWRVWRESGKWDERGRGGYVMGRYGDGDVPYSATTVYICTQAENASDSFVFVPHSTRNTKGKAP